MDIKPTSNKKRIKLTFRNTVLVPVYQGPDEDFVPMNPPIWSNAKDITVVEKDPMVSEGMKSKVMNFAPQYNGYVETFDVPKSLTNVKISVFSIIGDQYYDCGFEFDTSDVTHEDSEGNEIEYIRYTDNRGYAAGSRKIRVSWR